jgi:hypothetical protein
MPSTKAWPDDEHLVRQCLEGDPLAWHALVQDHLHLVVAWIDRRLRAGRYRSALAEDLALSVWERLYEDQGKRLRAYDPERGSLRGYRLHLARDELRLYRLRQARPPRCLEAPLKDQDVPDPQPSQQSVWALEEDLLAGLTRLQHWCVRKCLRPEEEANPGSRSTDALYKLQQRLWEEVRRRLGLGE